MRNKYKNFQNFISNDKTTRLRSSNHNILYSVYKKEKENINKPYKETNLINTNNKIDYFSIRYYNTNKNVKLNVINNKENKENKINKKRQSLRTENLRENYTRRINTNNDNNSRDKNNNKIYNRNGGGVEANNLEASFGNSRNNNISINNKIEKSIGRKKYYDYKKIKWNIKKHLLKTNDKKEIINYNSPTNILLSNRNDKIKKKFILILLISLCYILFNLISIRNKNEPNNKIIIDDILCEKTLKRLYNRTKPFEYEDELIFMIDLISCDIPFSFIRFGDGENSIMIGKELRGIDK